MFYVSCLQLDDALKPATPLTNGAISGVASLSALYPLLNYTLYRIVPVYLLQAYKHTSVYLHND